MVYNLAPSGFWCFAKQFACDLTVTILKNWRPFWPNKVTISCKYEELLLYCKPRLKLNVGDANLIEMKTHGTMKTFKIKLAPLVINKTERKFSPRPRANPFCNLFKSIQLLPSNFIYSTINPKLFKIPKYFYCVDRKI